MFDIKNHAYLMNLDSKSDQDLLKLMKVHNSKAFQMLYIRYWDSVLHFAYQKTKDLMTAEDIVQDIFVSLWNRREELVITSSFRNYLMVSIKYRVIKFLDKQRGVRLDDELNQVDLVDDSTQEWLEFIEIKTLLEQLVSHLPDKYRIVYLLHKEEGLSHKEIAQCLELSEQAVNSRLVRARRSLSVGIKNYMSMFFL